ncbi:hypothetical protein D1872_338010 [compost metagenome]
MNVVDNFLQRPETYGDPFCQYHFHQVLLYRIFGNLIVGYQHQICPRKSDPLNADLTVNQAFINPA